MGLPCHVLVYSESDHGLRISDHEAKTGSAYRLGTSAQPGDTLDQKGTPHSGILEKSPAVRNRKADTH